MEPKHVRYEQLIKRCKKLPAASTAVAHPCDESSLRAAVDAAKAGLIAPILVGPPARIREIASKAGLDIAGYPIVEAAYSQESAEKAVKQVRDGHAEALMKGSLHTDELMGAVVRRDTGLRTARRISHCFVMDVPGYPEALIITDAAVNIAPSLKDKVDIVQNAIDLAHDLGAAEVRVAILSAMETVNPDVPIDAGSGRAMQDGGPQTNHRRPSRRAARARQCDQPGSRQNQEDRFAGRRASQCAGGARPRGGKYACQEPELPRRGGRRRHRAWRARADHFDQPRRFTDCAARFMRSGIAGGQRPTRERR